MEFDKDKKLIYLDSDEQEILNEGAVVPYGEAVELLDKTVGIRDGYVDVNPSEQLMPAARRELQRRRDRGVRVASHALQQLADELGGHISTEAEEWLKSES